MGVWGDDGKWRQSEPNGVVCFRAKADLEPQRSEQLLGAQS